MGEEAASAFPRLPFFVRALYERPVQDAADVLPVRRMRVYQVTDVAHPDWWVAQDVSTGAVGRIPSRRLAEREFLDSPDGIELEAQYQAKQEQRERDEEGDEEGEDAEPASVNASLIGQATKTPEQLRAERLAIHTYHIVEEREPKDNEGRYCRAVVLAGPQELRATLLKQLFETDHGDLKFGKPLLHTSRTPRKNERDGREYHFITESRLLSGFQSNQFIQAAKFQSTLYALSVSAVEETVTKGEVPLLELTPNAVTRLQSFAKLDPIVIIASQPGEIAEPEDRVQSQRAREAFAHCETSELLFNPDTPEDAISQALTIIRAGLSCPKYWGRVFQVLPSNPPAPGKTYELPPVSMMLRRSADGSFGLTLAGVQRRGLYVHEAKPGGAAERAGLKSGMQILELNGESMVGFVDQGKVMRILQSSSSELPMLIRGQVLQIPSSDAAAEEALTRLEASLKAERMAAALMDADAGGAAPAQVPAAARPALNIMTTWEVKLKRGNEGFGMRVISDPQHQAVRVAEVFPKSPASKSGKVHPGDVIVEINGRSVVDAAHEEVVSIMRSSKKMTVLLGLAEDSEVLEEPTLGLDERTVTLRRDASGFGMQVATLDSGRGAEIREITPGSPAGECKEIKVGDIIVEINGRSIRTWSHEEVVKLLRKTNVATLKVRQSDRAPAEAPRHVPTKRAVVLHRSTSSGGQGFGVRLKPETDGQIVVEEVIAGSAAAKSGQVFRGDVLHEVDDRPVSNYNDVLELMRHTSQVKLGLKRVEAGEQEEEQLCTPEKEAEAASRWNLEDARLVFLSRKGGRGLGLKIQSVDQTSCGAWVHEVAPVGAAIESGKVRPLDVIVEANGKDMLNAPHYDIVKTLTSTRDILLLLSSDENLIPGRARLFQASKASLGGPQGGLPNPEAAEEPGLTVVQLARGARGFGLRIICDERNGISRVSGLLPGGAAEECGKLNMGDVLVKVDGQSVAGKSYNEVVRLLSLHPVVTIAVRPDSSPLPVPSGQLPTSAASSAAQSPRGSSAALPIAEEKDEDNEGAEADKGGEGDEDQEQEEEEEEEEDGAGESNEDAEAENKQEKDEQEPKTKPQADPEPEAEPVTEPAKAPEPEPEPEPKPEPEQEPASAPAPASDPPAASSEAGSSAEDTQSPEPEADPNAASFWGAEPEVRTVRLTKGAKGFGMKINSSESGAGGIKQLKVGSVNPGSPAAECGQVFPGDKILSVNGQSMVGASYNDAVAALKGQTEIVLELQQPE